MLQATEIVVFKSSSENTSMDFYKQTNYSRYAFCPNTEISEKHTCMQLRDCFQSLPKGPDQHILSVYGHKLHLI